MSLPRFKPKTSRIPVNNVTVTTSYFLLILYYLHLSWSRIVPRGVPSSPQVESQESSVESLYINKSAVIVFS
jgi:hypothetical protein